VTARLHPSSPQFPLWKNLLVVLGMAVTAFTVWLYDGRGRQVPHGLVIVNVSYDPTRELWRDLNALFVPAYEERTGQRLTIQQSHGGSGSQARAVGSGAIDADVVTLALWSDTDSLRARGLLASGWEQRLPYRSVPYFSTIVFVVRRGNPKHIHDWRDLVRPDVEVITPDPKTSGNGKLSFLAAWGAIRRRGGSEDDARAFMAELYRRVPVLDAGARGATGTFLDGKVGDVHLTWENEAHLEIAQAAGEVEIIYPAVSIRAEPVVAVVDANVDRKGTRAAAEVYLAFLYTDAAQEVLAAHFYRPVEPRILAAHAAALPSIELFPITDVAPGWPEAQAKFFAEGALFDQIDAARGMR
jgi:sulfate/thiosulfate transport system substrate-binding protein